MPSVKISKKTIVEAVCSLAEFAPQLPVYTFEAGDSPARKMRSFELVQAAQAVASLLAERRVRSPVALLFPTNSYQFICGFFGCIFNGTPAVPMTVPNRPANVHRTMALMRNAAATTVLTNSCVARTIREALENLAPGKLSWIEIDEIDPQLVNRWSPPALHNNHISHLQYTSGSTTSPRGVAITHENVLSNLAYIDRDFQHGQHSVAVSWLPHFHDMGLIYGILAPPILGFPVVLLDPADFAREPSRWLKAISTHSATHSGGPNFAFEVCASRQSVASTQDLDLSSWRIAFLGSEMVRPGTLERFARAFSGCGFDRKAFYPAYGLAEATLKVTGRSCMARDPIFAFSKVALQEGQVKPVAKGSKDAIELVSCGSASDMAGIAVVETGGDQRALPNTVGEIWVTGPGLALGYWNGELAATQSFRSQLPNDERFFLRTGDLGFFHDKELFVTGRAKEIIILRGVNLSPGDLEACMAESHDRCRGQGGVAFSVDDGTEEHLILMQEVHRHTKKEEYRDLMRHIRLRVAREFGAVAEVVALVAPGGIPRTTSGKIQRLEAKERYLAQVLPTLARCRRDDMDEVGFLSPFPAKMPVDLSIARRMDVVAEELLAELNRIKDAEVDRIASSDIWEEISLDSIEIAQLMVVIQVSFGVRLAFSEVLGCRNVGEVARMIVERSVQQQNSTGHGDSLHQDRPRPGCASADESRMWALHAIYPNCPAHRIAFSVKINGPLDVDRIRAALNQTVLRHSALRSAYVFDNGVLSKRAVAAVNVRLNLAEGGVEGEAQEKTCLERTAEALCRTPVSMESGELCFFTLMQFSENAYALVAALHHIACDAVSVEVFFDSLVQHYSRLADESGAISSFEAGPEFDEEDLYSASRFWTTEDVEFWRQQLSSASDSVRLPCKTDARAIVGSRAAEMPLHFDLDTVRRLRLIGARHQATLFMVLLTAFARAIGAWAEIEEITLVSPVGGRAAPQSRHAIGLFAHPLILRLQALNGGSFSNHLRLTKHVVTNAIAHQEVPFSEVVKVAFPQRRAQKLPFMDVMFNYIRRREKLHTQGLDWELIPLSNGSAESLLTLFLMEDRQSGLEGRLKYPEIAFSAQNVFGLGRSFVDMIHRAEEDVDACVEF